MDICKYCIYFNNKNTYKGTGYCELTEDYVREDDTCIDWEE